MNFTKSDMATKQQIRNYYTDQGYACRISNDGRVEFHRGGLRWQDGRWQSEYRIIDGQVVHK